VEFVLEDISAVKKKINITVDPKEVEAAILAAVTVYRGNVQLDGFRKGKVPLSVVESRFHDKIYQEAKQDLVNVHIHESIEKFELSPVSSIEFDGKDLVRDQPYSYSISFEVLPTFELPVYEGMEVEQEKAIVDEAEVDEVINRILNDRAEYVPCEGKGPAVDGQVVELDFQAFENGEPVKDIAAQGFQLSLGERQALESFEDLVKSVEYGEEKEGEVTFPKDFIAPDLAGKTLTMRVRVHAIKDKKLPDLNNILAKTLGYDDVDKLRSGIVDSYMKSRENLHKAASQKNLLDRLLKMVDFELPGSMVELFSKNLLADMKARLERQGKGIESLNKKQDELRAEVLPEAENITRSQVLLLAVAKKEELTVEEQEVDVQLHQMCARTGEDFKEIKDAYVRSGMVFVLRDRILADKAMDMIYAKAKVTEIDPVSKSSTE